MIKFISSYSIEGFDSATFDELEDFLLKSRSFSVDIETNGLDPHSCDILMLQVGDMEVQYVVDCRYVEVPEKIKELICDGNALGANLKFEYKFFLGSWKKRMSEITDVIIQEMILECGKKSFGFSLAALVKKYLNIDLPKATRLEFLSIGMTPFSPRHLVYGAEDIKMPILVNEKQQILIEEQNLQRTVYLENKEAAVVGEMEFNGLFVDSKRWEDLAIENTMKMRQYKEKLDSYVIDNNIHPFVGTIDLFTSRPRCAIEWTSQKQVVPLFRKLGIPTRIIDKDKTRSAAEKLGMDIEIYKDSIGKAEISQYASKFEILPIYLLFKKYEQASTTFGHEWLKNINPTTKRVHSDFWQILNTGRMASRKPNVQQIPSYKSKERLSAEAHRSCFIAPEGRTLIVKDYSGQELRILADVSGEDSMIEEFIHGKGDLHSLTASKVYSSIENKHIPVNKKENAHLRSVGKTLNFAISYGAGAYKISKGLGISSDEAQDIIDSYYSSFPKLRDYFSKGHSFARSNGYILIDSYLGRRSYFAFFEKFKEMRELIEVANDLRRRGDSMELPKSFWSEFYIMKGSMERASQNYRIQGLAASMTKIALLMFYQDLKKKNLLDTVKIVLALHDEIVVEAPIGIAEEINDLLGKFMIDAGKLFCPSVPMIAEGGITKIWDH